MLKRLRNKITNVALGSLVLSLGSLLVVLATIDGNIATWIFTLSTLITGIVDRVRPEWIDNFVLKWNGLASFTHFALIFFEVGGLIYWVAHFVKNYHFEVVANDPGIASSSTRR